MKEKIKVLLAEDELTLAMIIKDTLEEDDFILTIAANGEEGLRMFFDIRPDVLVADVMMPRMDGFEMVRRIRQTDKQTPVLFLTARSAINDVVEGFELGANDYLKKPFGMQELIIRIKALVGKAFSFNEEKKTTTRFEIGNYLFDSLAQTLTYAGLTSQVASSSRLAPVSAAKRSKAVLFTKRISVDFARGRMTSRSWIVPSATNSGR